MSPVHMPEKRPETGVVMCPPKGKRPAFTFIVEEKVKVKNG
jgi:hypothetical protein